MRYPVSREALRVRDGLDGRGNLDESWSRPPRQVDHRYKARRARITGSANRL
nr:MAG TPA: hypothetical protein [Caudoviricetes sp.]